MKPSIKTLPALAFGLAALATCAGGSAAERARPVGAVQPHAGTHVAGAPRARSESKNDEKDVIARRPARGGPAGARDAPPGR